ncbi:PAS domain-containing sensor histidine kinase [Marinibactrum halimedae]|uniref:Sensor protein FixL n=1 Tax=Marinibactrum halimedae TaxID=1444977 RepID=A0AA37T8P1_9GAMM|nr:PAS domain-containing sensor histidine kinase [Marinibactrum halimedae]MCD9459794.1 PAS domain S-box protein [Marinibactrum halimedae]GLS27013.1 hypothetical protein GCM10007877_27320 [Marinibactrum halimedae]
MKFSHNDVLQAVMKTVIDGLIIIDQNGIILAFNDSASRIFGYKSSEVLNKNVKILMPDPYHSEHDQYLSNHLKTGIKKVIGKGREIIARRKSGEQFPMELGVNGMELDGEKFFVGTIRDISERKLAEKDIKDHAERSQAIMNTVLDGLIIIDHLGIIQEFNPSASRIFGYTREEVLGNNVKILMPEPYRSEHDTYLSNYESTGEKKVIGMGREILACRKSGEVFPMELGVNKLETFKETLYVGTIRDITTKKEAEKSIEQFIKNLETSNQELDQFAYIASHDLKEPLRGIANNAQFLQEDYAALIEEGGNRRINRINFLCRRMERLVDELLYYSRLGRQALAIQECNIKDLVTDVIETVIEPDSQDIHIKLEDDLPTIYCDKPRTRELFRNLIVNAIKYNNKPQKNIHIGYKSIKNPNDEETYQAFYIEDNGIGIDKRFHSDIFKIFKRLNEESEITKGSGVGLTFVKKIVEKHNGEIWLDSRIDEGTIFYFTLKSKNQEFKEGV